MLERFFSTEPNLIFTAARIVLGVVMFPHGFQKLFGWFGGYGFGPTLQYFTSIGVPKPIAFLVIIAESFGAIGLVLGLFTKLSAFGIILVMIGAAIFVRQHGFFMNWFGNQAGEGFEYHLLAIALAGILLFGGAGAFSIDGWILQKLK